MSGVEVEDGVSPAAAQHLKIIAGAMSGGLVLMAGLVLWSYAHAAPTAPAPAQVMAINTLTTVMMVAALIAIAGSEFAWRAILRKTPGALGVRVQTAFIARLAFREGAGLLGMTVAYVAALNGVLRAYPAYWVNLAPFALFLGFLAAHWPSADTLAAEAGDILGSRQ